MSELAYSWIGVGPGCRFRRGFGVDNKDVRVMHDLRLPGRSSAETTHLSSVKPVGTLT